MLNNIAYSIDSAISNARVSALLVDTGFAQSALGVDVTPFSAVRRLSDIVFKTLANAETVDFFLVTVLATIEIFARIFLFLNRLD